MEKAAREEEASVAAELGRMRHHAELTVMMTMQFSNAAELAVAICQSGADGQGGAADSALQAKLQAEQARLVRDSLEAFGHPARKSGLPKGDVESCLQ